MTPTFSARPCATGALRLLSLAAGCSLIALTAARADAPAVVTSIKPLQSIAAAVMEGVGKPAVLIDGAASPHGFALKPSQAGLLQDADVVFWIGPELSPSLDKPISSMAEGAVRVELLETDGLSHLELREGANFDPHDHGHHDHAAGDHDDDEHDSDHHEAEADHDHDHEHGAEEHVEHGHDDEDHEAHEHDDHDHGAEEHADHDEHDHEHEAHEHGEEEHEDAHHHHGDERDPHIWLNPDNGIAIAATMAETLSAADPEHADIYRSNAKAFAERIESLEKDIAAELAPVHGGKFIVFHDAYHHFEHHFDIEASGAITVSPEALASADRIATIRGRIADLGVTCVFQEPQFEARLVSVVLEGSDARSGTLDPLGTTLENGPDLYPALLKGLAGSLVDCLGEK